MKDGQNCIKNRINQQPCYNIMVKTIILLCLCLLSNPLIAQDKMFQSEQTALYKISFLSDTLAPENITEELGELLINDNTSLFRSVSQGVIDSALHANRSRQTELGMNIYINNRTKMNYSVLKNNGKIKYFDHIYEGFTDFYFYNEKVENQQWKVLEDTITINGFFCQTARLNYGNREWIAYFSHSIPIFDGPYKFAGLPGLIILMEDSLHHWKFELISLKNAHRNTPYGDMRFHYSIIDKEEFYKKRKFVKDNAYELEMASGSNKGVNQSGLSRLKSFYNQRKKADNNWIELYP